jgi:hypothetical protein
VNRRNAASEAGARGQTPSVFPLDRFSCYMADFESSNLTGKPVIREFAEDIDPSG